MVIYLQHKIYKKTVSSVEAGMGTEGQIMYIDRTMHIFDVISSVSRSSKCNKIVGGRGFFPDSTGELTALSRPPSWVQGAYFKAPTSKASGREGRGRAGRQIDVCPRHQKLSRDHWSSKLGQGALKHWVEGGTI